jgi:DNA (cytosine-5)-methyltransferase 1
MIFFDLFAGIGGFRKGLENHNHECIGSCEIDNNARKSYIALYGEDDCFYEDVAKIDINRMPDFEILCAGFPCQPFSRAGRRNGFEEKGKGDLFFEILRIARAKRPRILFLENVYGLTTTGEKIIKDGKKVEINKGIVFRRILYELSELGYDIQWQIINSAQYIAHKRLRVYIIAHLRSDNFTMIFPMKGKTEIVEFDRKSKKEVLHAICNKVNGKKSLFFKLRKHDMLDENKENFLFTNKSPWKNWGIVLSKNCITAEIPQTPKKIYPLRDLLDDNIEELRKYILTEAEIEKQKYAKSGKTWKASGNKMGNMAFPDNTNKPSRTLTANSSGREMMVIEILDEGQKKYRKLTPLEYWRLQGFSDDDYKAVTNADVPEGKLKEQAGNAVTVNVIDAIGERLQIFNS